jgi:DNA (cytosine-5)-methyltransferase 1
MTHGSLFSGIGGFDLAAHWMGWDNIFHCEWNEFGQKVLKHHFPTSKSYNDITKTDFSIHRGEIDILTGGFPCQPYSTAGLRKGKADERHLFPEMLRAIKEIKPRWIIGENVRGLVSWGGGLVFEEVCSDLEREGYEVQPFLIPAASVNAPHRRDRIWFVANSNNKRGCTKLGEVSGKDAKISEWDKDAQFSHTDKFYAANTECLRLEHIEERGNIYQSTSKAQSERGEFTKSIKANGNNGDVANTISERGQLQTTREYASKQMLRSNGEKRRIREWEKFPTVSPVCNGNDGLSDRLDSITFSKWRKESIKSGGNAIVPQVAYELFKTIELFENSL